MIVTAIICIQVATCVPAAVNVIDGDTLRVDAETIRLLGLDAPETSRAACGTEAAAGMLARQWMAEHLSGARVTIERAGQDSLGRTLASVSAGGADLTQAAIADGVALPYVAGKHRQRQAHWCGN